MSATRRDRRGQGLATLAKIESARRAASLGITRIRTSNDLGNEPMLAVNRKLGFTATGIVESFSKRLFEPYSGPMDTWLTEVRDAVAEAAGIPASELEIDGTPHASC